MAQEQNEFVKSRFVRQQLAKTENLTLKQLQAAWNKCPDAPRKLPTQQDIYTGISNVRNKYGLKELPYRQGKLNLSELARSLKVVRPKLDVSRIHTLITNDGFSITRDGIKKALEPLAKQAADDHPDPNFDKGPRAGAPAPKEEPKKSDRRTKLGRVNVTELKAVKGLIDELGGIDKARKAIEAVKMAGDVKAAETALDALEELQL